MKMVNNACKFFIIASFALVFSTESYGGIRCFRNYDGKAISCETEELGRGQFNIKTCIDCTTKDQISSEDVKITGVITPSGLFIPPCVRKDCCKDGGGVEVNCQECCGCDFLKKDNKRSKNTESYPID